MKRKPENIKNHELIGLEAEVSDSTNPYNEGISGSVIDETRNTINISGKKIPKKDSTFIFNLPSGKRVKVSGDVILDFPEERIKN